MSDVSSNNFFFSDEEYSDIVEDDTLFPQIREAQIERGPLYSQGIHLQHRLARYFSYKRSIHASNESDEEVETSQPHTVDGSVEQEQRYLRALTEFDQAREQLFSTIEVQDEAVELEMDKLKEKEEKLADLRQTSKQLRLSIAEDAMHSTTKKPLSVKQLEKLENQLQTADEEVSRERLVNIHLNKQLLKYEGGFQKKDEGPQLIDFEQLRLENHSFSDKIEERNEELMVLKKKINSTIQMISHIKQKFTFVEANNDRMRSNLTLLDEDLSAHRDALTKLKRVKEQLRTESNELRNQTGLIGNPVLYEDFLNRESRIEELKIKAEELKSELLQYQKV
ncbi:hypothetical protein P9112_011169 [Eukaryota sp. TZLM1-RC]